MCMLMKCRVEKGASGRQGVSGSHMHSYDAEWGGDHCMVLHYLYDPWKLPRGLESLWRWLHISQVQQSRRTRNSLCHFCKGEHELNSLKTLKYSSLQMAQKISKHMGWSLCSSCRRTYWSKCSFKSRTWLMTLSPWMPSTLTWDIAMIQTWGNMLKTTIWWWVIWSKRVSKEPRLRNLLLKWPIQHLQCHISNPKSNLNLKLDNNP